jgi:hypothetical protein
VRGDVVAAILDAGTEILVLAQIVATTRGPAVMNALAIARPIPPEPPVINATWPARLGGPLRCCAM